MKFYGADNHSYLEGYQSLIMADDELYNVIIPDDTLDEKLDKIKAELDSLLKEIKLKVKAEEKTKLEKWIAGVK